MAKTNYPVLDATMKAIDNFQDQPWNLKTRNQFQVLEEDLFNLGQRDQANIVNRYVMLMDNGLTVDGKKVLSKLNLNAPPTHPLATASVSDKKPRAGEQIIETTAQVVENKPTKTKLLPFSKEINYQYSKDYTSRPLYIINGRPIYERGTWQEGRKLTEVWEKAGSVKGQKPLFIDAAGEFFEIEKGGEQYQSKEHNPKGWTFSNYINHLVRNFNRRGKLKGATPDFKTVFNVMKQKFPEVSDAELRLFTNSVMKMNKYEIAKTLKNRLPGQHADHTVPISKGGLNWFTNIKNRPILFNLKKGGIRPSDVFTKLTGLYDKQSTIGKLHSNIRLDKPGSRIEQNLLSKDIFNRGSKTYTNLNKPQTIQVKPTPTKGVIKGKGFSLNNFQGTAPIIQTYTPSIHRNPTLMNVIGSGVFKKESDTHLQIGFPPIKYIK